MHTRRNMVVLSLVGLAGLLAVSDADAFRFLAPQPSVTISGVCYQSDGTTPQPNVTIAVKDPAGVAIVATSQTNPSTATGTYAFTFAPGTTTWVSVTYTSMAGTTVGPFKLSTSQAAHKISPVVG